MHTNSLQELVANTDIYLLDQIMKGRYQQEDTILDAGCGTGRNMHWFLFSQIKCYGTDIDVDAIEALHLQHPALPADWFRTALVEQLPFADHFFDHVISSAVLHFARNMDHFHRMLAEMIRVLKPGGILFIRMTADIGIETKVELVADGVYSIPDGSTRFLLTRALLSQLLKAYPLQLIEPVKTVNVADIRCMTTLVLQRV
jgi:tellurite methyltransferase